MHSIVSLNREFIDSLAIFYAFFTPDLQQSLPRVIFSRYGITTVYNSGSQSDELVPLHFGFTRKRARHFSLLPLVLFLLCFLAVGGSATAAFGATVQNAGPAPVSSFVVADLDGDQRPDVANVQVGKTNSASSDYWIELKLSASGRQFIGLVAPPGGLAIEARDVNGDRDLDLVVRSAWFRNPIAIFLNDGHGRFLRAQPSAFPGAWVHSNFSWAAISNPEDQTIASVRSQSRDSISQQVSAPYHGRPPTGAAAVYSFNFPANRYLLSHAGRAPPSEAVCL